MIEVDREDSSGTGWDAISGLRWRWGVLVLACLAVVVVVVSSAAAAGPVRDRAGIVRCLNGKRVLTDAAGSQYLSAVVAPRSRQVAISFPFTAGEVGLAGIIVVTPSPAAARAAVARLVAYSVASGGGSATRIRSFIEQRGSVVVGWWGVKPKAGATKILTACLGSRTDR